MFAWTVTVDPLTTALGFVHVQVERRFGENLSLYAGPSLKLFDSPLGIAAGPYRGYGIEAGLRVFPWGKAPRGPWVMARGVLADVVYRSELLAAPDEVRPTFQSVPGGYTSVLAGYTGIIAVGAGKKSGLVLSGGLGVSYFAYAPENVGGVHGFLPAAHTNIGWGF